jgi:preprotein translocase subunit SecG
MNYIVSVLPYIQIVLAVLMTAAILLQRSSASLGGAFGDNFSSAFHTRRGFEKTLFNATIVLAILFIVSALIALIR